MKQSHFIVKRWDELTGQISFSDMIMIGNQRNGRGSFCECLDSEKMNLS